MIRFSAALGPPNGQAGVPRGNGMATTEHATDATWEQIRQPGWVKLINAAGQGLGRVGVRWPRLDPGRLMASARRATGLSDFGDERFREGLRVLVGSLRLTR